jgi:hypothetical protein
MLPFDILAGGDRNRFGAKTREEAEKKTAASTDSPVDCLEGDEEAPQLPT